MNGSPVFQCCVTNTAAQAEGDFRETWLSFPASPEDVQEAFRQVGLDGTRYREYLLSDFTSPLPGLRIGLSETDTIDELNYLSKLIADMKPSERKVFEAVLEKGSFARTAESHINLAINLEKFTLLAGIHDAVDYGMLLHESDKQDYAGLIERLAVSEDVGMQALALYIRTLETHFDAGSYGATMAEQEKGRFTCYGYLLGEPDLDQKYDGKSIPAEYMITSYLAKKTARRSMRARVRTAVRIHRERV
ncbi:antirestriction protein ArdA [Ruminococcaceae bacterium OttesenSCG-928-A16]|nr:antirestriction protein ArdA [Ruminococcaceae bacterium OttesenSCG-928-A16]